MVALTILVFWVFRAPFLAQPLVGEEGIFADLYLNSPPGPDYGLMARINGIPLRAPLSHPAPLYESMTHLGSLARRYGWTPVPSMSSDMAIRSLNSLFQLAFWVTLAVTVPWRRERTQGIAIAAYLAMLISPLAVGGSLYLQVDTTVGWLACGILAIAVQAGGVSAWALSGLVLGFVGKQEWSICLALAAAMTLGWGLFMGQRRSAGPLGLVVLAALAGSFSSWTFDPVNWSEGADVMLSIAAEHTVLSTPSSLGSWFYNLLRLAPFLGALTLGLATQAWLVLRRGWRRAEIRSAFGLSFSIALTAPFLMSTWVPEYRYVAPALAAVSAGMVFELLRTEVSRTLARRLVLILGVSAALGVVFMTVSLLMARSVTEGPMASVEGMLARERSEVLAARQTGCVPRLSSGFAYALLDLDFVGSAISVSDAEAIAAKAGRALCADRG
ncbi:MAG TPA: hypothetical protein VGV06_06070 [Methylomirabilota bacterium]|nr:hypothetical protein [Methylomirabilota bacterium]